MADDPVNAQARGDIGYSCARIGELLAVRGDYVEALANEHKALELYEKLTADSPQDLHTDYQTGVVASMMAELCAKLGKRDEALVLCAKAVDLLKELREDPANTLYNGLRAQAYLHLAAAHAEVAASKKITTARQQEDWCTARDLYPRSFDIWQDVRKRGVLTSENAIKAEQVASELQSAMRLWSPGNNS